MANSVAHYHERCYSMSTMTQPITGEHDVRDDYELLTSDVARIAEKTPATIRVWERAGKLPARRTVGGTRLFRRSDVEAALLKLK